VKIGLVPSVLPQEQVKALMDEPGEITVDLDAQTAGPYSFEFRRFRARVPPATGSTTSTAPLQHEDEIAAFRGGAPAAVRYDRSLRTASPNSAVVALPPRSRVGCEASVLSIAA
jgi:hypothetical protein